MFVWGWNRSGMKVCRPQQPTVWTTWRGRSGTSRTQLQRQRHHRLVALGGARTLSCWKLSRVASSLISFCPGSSRWKADCWNAYLWTWLGAHGREWGDLLKPNNLKQWKIFPQNGLFCLTAGNSPRGPYTGQLGFLGYYEILQALNNDTWVWQFSVGILSENRLGWCIAQFQNLHSLPWLSGATPKAWETVVDGCYLAPYITNGPW